MDPNVPTIEEKGLGEFNLGAWIGLFAVKGTPKPIIDKLHGALNRALADPETNRKLVGLGTEVVVSETPAAFGQFVAKNYKLWGEMVEISGLEKK
jgi:tripartite-type tricarboxylate transporter receptor subunit TctC